MSRRHKETEIKDNSQQIEVASQADNHLRGYRFNLSSPSLLERLVAVKKPDKKKSIFSMEKISAAIEKISHILGDPLSISDIEIDEKWVKIPRSYFDDEIVDKMTQGKGRPFIKRLFNRITDNEVVDCFKKTLHAVKKKCTELYENLAQYAVCFLKGSNQAFAPDDDPYGKLSHFHRILNSEFPDLPTCRTLNNYMHWFVEWEPVVTDETAKDKKERHRHRIWEQLIEWIYNYLKKIAPQYVVAYA